jgi:hypothetical protein
MSRQYDYYIHQQLEPSDKCISEGRATRTQLRMASVVPGDGEPTEAERDKMNDELIEYLEATGKLPK